jgi:hypothetical protein
VNRAIPGIIHIDINASALARHKTSWACAMETTGATLPAGFCSALAGTLEPAAEATPRRVTGRLYIGASGSGSSVWQGYPCELPESFLCRKVISGRRIRLFAKKPDVSLYAIGFDLSRPFSRYPAKEHSLIARGATKTPAGVGVVLGAGHNSQVLAPIIECVSVTVIDIGPGASHEVDVHRNGTLFDCCDGINAQNSSRGSRHVFRRAPRIRRDKRQVS